MCATDLCGVCVSHLAGRCKRISDSQCQDKIKNFKNCFRDHTAIFPFPSALPHPLLRDSGLSRNPGAVVTVTTTRRNRCHNAQCEPCWPCTNDLLHNVILEGQLSQLIILHNVSQFAQCDQVAQCDSHCWVDIVESRQKGSILHKKEAICDSCPSAGEGGKTTFF